MGTYLSTPVLDKSEMSGDDFECVQTPVSWGCVDMQGWRKSMEDAHVARTDVPAPPRERPRTPGDCEESGPMTEQNDGMGDGEDNDKRQRPQEQRRAKVFAVFDGHGGPEVARFCERHLVDVLVSGDKWRQRNIGGALVDAFHQLDRLIDDPVRRGELAELKAIAQWHETRHFQCSQETSSANGNGGGPDKQNDAEGNNMVDRCDDKGEEREGSKICNDASGGRVDAGSPGVTKSQNYSKQDLAAVALECEGERDGDGKESRSAAHDVVSKDANKHKGSKNPPLQSEADNSVLLTNVENPENNTDDGVMESCLNTEDVIANHEMTENGGGIVVDSCPVDEADDDGNDGDIDESDMAGDIGNGEDYDESEEASSGDSTRSLAGSEGSLDSLSDSQFGDDEQEDRAGMDADVEDVDGDGNDDEDENDGRDIPGEEATITTADAMVLFQKLMSIGGGNAVEDKDSPGGGARVLVSSVTRSEESVTVSVTRAHDEAADSGNKSLESNSSTTTTTATSNTSIVAKDDGAGGGSISASTTATSTFQASRSYPNGRKVCTLPDHPIQAGCTSIVAVLIDRVLTVANAGDSRAVLCRSGGVVHPLSFDHKPLHDREMERINRAGGFVNQFGRVNGNLNLSRSIGDLKYKQTPGLPPSEQMITAEPDVTEVELRDDDEFVIIGCDGIWDCLSNAEAVQYVSNRIEDKLPTEIVVEMLDEIVSDDPRATQGIGGDNMTCMIVDLRPGSRRHRQVRDVSFEGATVMAGSQKDEGSTS